MALKIWVQTLSNITVFAKVTSTTGGPYYAWWSTDNFASSQNRWTTSLTTGGVLVGTLNNVIGGSILTFTISTTSIATWMPTTLSTATYPAAGNSCIDPTYSVTPSDVTIYLTGNQARYGLC